MARLTMWQLGLGEALFEADIGEDKDVTILMNDAEDIGEDVTIMMNDDEDNM
jgi:hypothetical protein